LKDKDETYIKSHARFACEKRNNLSEGELKVIILRNPLTHIKQDIHTWL